MFDLTNLVIYFIGIGVLFWCAKHYQWSDNSDDQNMATLLSIIVWPLSLAGIILLIPMVLVAAIFIYVGRFIFGEG